MVHERDKCFVRKISETSFLEELMSPVSAPMTAEVIVFWTKTTGRFVQKEMDAVSWCLHFCVNVMVFYGWTMK